MSSNPQSSESSNPKQPQQPGVVLGPDGKPCKPCTAFRNWKPVGTGKDKKAAGGGTAGMMAALASGQALSTEISGPPADCPADVEQLGRATWTFLHTTAAYYPTSPTPTQQSSMLGLLHSLPSLYPCSHCASHLGENLKAHPPEGAVGGREVLMKWLCERHNDVNVRLGKGMFDCGIGSLDERWRDGPGDGRCD